MSDPSIGRLFTQCFGIGGEALRISSVRSARYRACNACRRARSRQRGPEAQGDSHRMTWLCPPRRLPVLLLVAVALAAATSALSPSPRARAATGTIEPITVTVDPTNGLTDGQLIDISATASSGTMSEIRAHICMHDQPPGGVTNTFDFGFQGEFCANTRPGAGDFEQFE